MILTFFSQLDLETSRTKIGENLHTWLNQTGWINQKMTHQHLKHLIHVKCFTIFWWLWCNNIFSWRERFKVVSLLALSLIPENKTKLKIPKRKRALYTNTHTVAGFELLHSKSKGKNNNNKKKRECFFFFFLPFHSPLLYMIPAAPPPSSLSLSFPLLSSSFCWPVQLQCVRCRPFFEVFFFYFSLLFFRLFSAQLAPSSNDKRRRRRRRTKMLDRCGDKWSAAVVI